MSRRVTTAMALVIMVLLPGINPATATAPPAALMAGYGQADSTWHVGACAGQYCDTRNPFSDPLSGPTDPYAHNRLKAASYGIQSRLTTRAIVVDGAAIDGTPRRIALVKTDNYLAQDLLLRRVAQLLEDAGSAIGHDDILHAASHNHSSPYQATLAAGVWIFTDAYDMRAFEFSAQAMADAILQAEGDLRPARMSATVLDEHVFKGNIAGLRIADDGSPAGYPRDFGDLGVTVMAFNTLDGQPIAAWVNHGQHPEGLDGYGLLTADFLAPFERFVARDTGYPVVFSQGDVGSAEGPYLGWENATPLPSGEIRAWAHVGFAQLERGARYLADTVSQALADINAGEGQVPWSEDALVDARSVWVPGPLSQPYPQVSNCSTATTLGGEPGVPVAGLPDCGRGGGIPLPGQMVADSLAAHGLGVPDHYGAPSYGAVEENARLRLQAFRVGEVLMASCACEPQVDLILNLQTRTDQVADNMWLGYDWSTRCTDNGDGTSTCDRSPDRTANDLVVDNDALELLAAQVNNDAAGWDDPTNVLAANSENPDRSQLWGNFTHDELPPDLGYGLPVGVGHAGDYNGYTVSYREYMAYDHYRKALTAYGPHTADYMVTRLVALARAMNDPAYVLPAELHAPALLVDEARQVALAETVGRGLGPAAQRWDAALPDDAGQVEGLQQPADISRFDGASFTWRGGATAVDTPIAVVERLVNGEWRPYADATGEVPVMVEQVEGLQGTLGALTGSHEWQWTAAFEAFSAFPARLGQTPEGTYRFTVAGHHRTGGQTAEYALVSDPFEVRAWEGIQVADVEVDEAGDAFAVVGDSTYPRTYDSPFAFIGDDGRTDVCKTCTFRPWAQTAPIALVEFTIERADGTIETVAATQTAPEVWTAVGSALQPGDTARVAAGSVRDTNGETNATAATS
ncbi:hypothetical protein BH23ACT9_BH23ACT9_31280 [soil metagenome]